MSEKSKTEKGGKTKVTTMRDVLDVLGNLFLTRVGLINFREPDESLIQMVSAEKERYGNAVEVLLAMSTVNPSVARFAVVCAALKKCFTMARREPVERNVASCLWYAVGFALLADHPHEGEQDDDAYFNFNDVEQKAMIDALTPLVDAIAMWSKKVTPPDLDWGNYRGVEKYIDDEMLFQQEVSEDGGYPQTVKRTVESLIFERNDSGVAYLPDVFKGMTSYVSQPTIAVARQNELTLQETNDELLKVIKQVVFENGKHNALKFYFECVRPLFETVSQEVNAARNEVSGADLGFDQLLDTLKNGYADDPWGFTLSEEDVKNAIEQLKKAKAAKIEKLSAQVDEDVSRIVERNCERSRAGLGDEGCEKDPVEDALDKIRWLRTSGSKVEFGSVVWALEALVRASLQATKWGLFGCPSYIAAITMLQQCGGDGCEIGTEDHSIEAGWRKFANTLSTYFRFFAKRADGHEIPNLAQWLADQKTVTYACSDTVRAPEASDYRGISADVCNGLFDISKQIALECFANTDAIDLMYAGVFSPDTDYYEFPPIVERNYSIDQYYNRLDLSAFALGIDGDKRFDGFQNACEIMLEGLKYANQATDLDLPKRDWFRNALEYLIQNPKGTATYENQDQLSFTRNEVSWIIDQFFPVVRSLQMWAEKAKGKDIPLAEQVLADINSFAVEDYDGEWATDWQSMLFRETFTPNHVTTWVYRPAVLQQWIIRLPLGCPTARMVNPRLSKPSVVPKIERPATIVVTPQPVAVVPEKSHDVEAESEDSDEARDEWSELYGARIHWFKISCDGTKIADLSDPADNEYGFTIYDGMTETAGGSRKALAFFFTRFRDEMKLDEKGNVVVQSNFYKFPNGAQSRQSLRQMTKGGIHKSFADFLKNGFEPKDKTETEEGKIVNTGGKWRIWNEPTKTLPKEDDFKRFEGF